MAEAPAEHLEKLKPAFPGKSIGGISNVEAFEVRGVRVTVLDVQVRWTTGPSDNETRYVGTQTVATYDSPNHRFPRFQLQPSGELLEKMARMAGMGDINFPSNPAFSGAFILTGTHPETVRRLFDHAPLQQALAQRAGLTVASDLSSLSLYRWEQFADAAARRALAEEAAPVFALLEQAAAAAREKPASKPDPRAYAASLPGAAGQALRKSLITRRELAAFLGQATPRTLPPEVRAWLNRAASAWILVMSALVLAVALLFLVLGLTSGQRLGDIWLEIAFPLLFAAAAVAGAVWTVRTRTRLKRLLRHGALAVARIEGIEATGNSSNNLEEYRMRIRFQAGASTVAADCTIAGHGHERARILKTDGKPAPILYDPANPQQVLFVEGLLSLSPEIEP